MPATIDLNFLGRVREAVTVYLPDADLEYADRDALIAFARTLPEFVADFDPDTPVDPPVPSASISDSFVDSPSESVPEVPDEAVDVPADVLVPESDEGDEIPEIEDDSEFEFEWAST